MIILSEIDVASVIFLIVIKAICVCIYGCVCLGGGGDGCMFLCFWCVIMQILHFFQNETPFKHFKHYFKGMASYFSSINILETDIY